MDSATEVDPTPDTLMNEDESTPAKDLTTAEDIEKPVNNQESTEPKTEQELLFCKLCDVQATDLQTYVNHVMRPSHVKKIAEAYNIRKTRDVSAEIFNCQDCLIQCNGGAAWNQHLLGQKHRKILEKKAARLEEQRQILIRNSTGDGHGSNFGGGPIKQKVNHHDKRPYQRPSGNLTFISGKTDLDNFKEPLIGLEHVTEIQVAGQNPRYHCTLCDSKFDHNLKFPHLVGAKHRINVLRTKKPEVVSEVRMRSHKRSELTAVLLREARILEEEEGRQHVKTRYENGPHAQTTNNYQGNSAPFQQSRGARGRRGRVNNRGSRGRGQRGNSRGGRGGRGGGAWDSGRQSTTSAAGTQHGNQPPQLPFPMPYNTSYDQWSMPYNEGYDSYNPNNFNASFDTKPVPQVPPNVGSDNFYSDVSLGYSTPVKGGHTSFPSNSTTNPEKEEARKSPAQGGLAAVLGDLTKLVQNEDDASVALHVSNALTQALLQYRIHQDGDKVE